MLFLKVDVYINLYLWKKMVLGNLCSDTVGALCHRMPVESQLVVLLGRDDDAFDDKNRDHADDAEADLDKNVQRSVFRIPGVLHLSLPATDDQADVEKMLNLLTVGMSNSISSLAGIFTLENKC